MLCALLVIHASTVCCLRIFGGRAIIFAWQPGHYRINAGMKSWERDEIETPRIIQTNQSGSGNHNHKKKMGSIAEHHWNLSLRRQLPFVAMGWNLSRHRSPHSHRFVRSCMTCNWKCDPKIRWRCSWCSCFHWGSLYAWVNQSKDVKSARISTISVADAKVASGNTGKHWLSRRSQRRKVHPRQNNPQIPRRSSRAEQASTMYLTDQLPSIYFYNPILIRIFHFLGTFSTVKAILVVTARPKSALLQRIMAVNLHSDHYIKQVTPGSRRVSELKTMILTTWPITPSVAFVHRTAVVYQPYSALRGFQTAITSSSAIGNRMPTRTGEALTPLQLVSNNS